MAAREARAKLGVAQQRLELAIAREAAPSGPAAMNGVPKPGGGSLPGSPARRMPPQPSRAHSAAPILPVHLRAQLDAVSAAVYNKKDAHTAAVRFEILLAVSTDRKLLRSTLQCAVATLCLRMPLTIAPRNGQSDNRTQIWTAARPCRA